MPSPLKIAITGASGFIGGALKKRLRAAGHSVYEVSRKELQSGMPTLAAKSEVMIHCASAGAQPPRDTGDIIPNNLILLNNAFRMSEQAKLFINFGSSSEYGTAYKPMSETDAVKPVGPYAVSKAMCTMLAQELGRQYGKDVITVRPFSVYGPGEADHRFIPTLIRSMITEEYMEIANGHMCHDWIYIDDFCDQILSLIDLEAKFRPEILNIGSGIQHSNREVYEVLKSIAQMDANVVIKDGPTNMWVADVSRAMQLGVYSSQTLESGLKQTLEYYEEKYA